MIGIESMTMIVFLLFAIMSLVAKLVFYCFEMDFIGYTTKIFFFAAFLLLFLVLFGLWQYEQVPAAFGGRQPHVVEIMIDDETVLGVLKDMGFEVTPFLKAKLIHENPQEFIVDLEGQTIRLSRNIVAGLKMLPIEDKHWLLE